MSNSTILSLNFTSQQITIYVGFFLFVVGLIGNPLTLLVFLSLKTFRESSCAFYLTVMSFLNTCHLFTGLFTFIMINGFATNWLNMSLFYCKFRPFYVQVCLMTSFSCMCLATIDQFLATCSHPRWQQLCNVKLARYLSLGIVTVWIVHGIPFLLYYNTTVSIVTGKSICTIVNVIFQMYHTYFYGPIVISVIPVTCIILFGLLTYRNIQEISYRIVPIVRRELDKQLTTMVLVHVFFDVIAVTPTVILGIFNLIYGIPTDSLVTAQLSLLSIVGTVMYNAHFVGSFYIFICVSKRFRQQFIYVVSTMYLNRFHARRINNNQIEPQA